MAGKPDQVVESQPGSLAIEEESPGTNPPGPPKLTIYPYIALPARAPSKTAIFFPDKFLPSASVDIILYLHGHLEPCGGSSSDTIQDYLNSEHFSLRELVNWTKKTWILVAPSLGAQSESGNLGKQGDDYLKKVLAHISARVARSPFNWKGGQISTSSITLAAHSGGGTTMLRLAQNLKIAPVPECWGYDSFYYSGVQEWIDWAAKGGKFFLFWHDEKNTGDNVRKFQRLLKLKANKIAAGNVVVDHASRPRTFWWTSTRDHCEVPKTFWPGIIPSI